MTIDLDEAPVEGIDIFPDDTVAVGDDWLASRRSAVLSVPSAIVPESRNLLLNPVHPDAERASIAAVRPFAFDGRLWRGEEAPVSRTYLHIAAGSRSDIGALAVSRAVRITATKSPTGNRTPIIESARSPPQCRKRRSHSSYCRSRRCHSASSGRRWRPRRSHSGPAGPRHGGAPPPAIAYTRGFRRRRSNAAPPSRCRPGRGFARPLRNIARASQRCGVRRYFRWWRRSCGSQPLNNPARSQGNCEPPPPLPCARLSSMAWRPCVGITVKHCLTSLLESLA